MNQFQVATSDLHGEMDEVLDRLRLTIGPLHYEFHAHDAWGIDALDRLRTHVVVQDFTEPTDRLLHLACLDMTRDEFQQIQRDRLPDRYAKLLPSGWPRHGWRMHRDETGHMTFQHSDWQHSLFLLGVPPSEQSGPFQLPWAILLQDMIVRGGAILHGGLIARSGVGYILTAPPGGGKTTCIARLPHEWQVLADDACLIWPGASNRFHASPLPTWSVLLGRTPIMPSIGRWSIGTNVAVRDVLLLRKSEHDRCDLMARYDRLLPLYRALCEHPQVLMNRVSCGTSLFDVARHLARSASVWELHVTAAGQFWEHIPTDTN